MKKIKNIHPGEVLKEEFLKQYNISAYRLCMNINVPQTRISEIIKGKRSITADTALRLSKYFGNTPNFWLGLQNDFDIEEEITQKGDEIKLIKRYKAN
jgi:addiction module HigA family antidote